MPGMPGSDTFPLVDRLVSGGLAHFLTAARAESESHETIAFRLRSEHDITVTSETVRRWCQRVGADEAARLAGFPADLPSALPSERENNAGVAS